MDIDWLDRMLGLFNKNNVAAAQFDSAGNMIGVQFKWEMERPLTSNYPLTRPVALNVTTESEAKVESAGGAQYNPSRKDSLIDLALHPPDDVRFPKDED